jgi:molybdopterin molybdotransferase
MGRISAAPLAATESVPAFDNSGMDGFVFRSSETRGASAERPLTFKILGQVIAGDAPLSPRPSDGACYEIMTGAPIPQGFDCVLKIEDALCSVDPAGNPTVTLTQPIEPGTFVRERGLDFSPGQNVLSSGTRVAPEHVMAAASLGITQLEVRRRPRVAIVSTGGEIVPHDTRELTPGQVRNSTTPHLMAALPLYGAEPRYYGHCGDDASHFLQLLGQALADGVDLILTTGAVSKGKLDYVPEAVRSAGGEPLFHEVAIRPGKPGFVASFKNGPILFGIPGNPVSTAVALRFFVSPALDVLQDLAPTALQIAALASDTRKPEGLRCFYKAHVDLTGPHAQVTAHASQPSFMVSPLLESNAWVVLPEEGALARTGSQVEIHPLHPHQGFGAPLSASASDARGPGGCC